MNRAKPLAMFAILSGSSLLALCFFFIVSGRIPGFESRPTEITFQITLEIFTALMLIINGLRVVFSEGNGEGLLLVSFGMLICTLLNLAGYYAEKGKTGILTVLLVLLSVTIYYMIIAFHSRKE